MIRHRESVIRLFRMETIFRPEAKIYDVTTRSILADSVYARTSTAYLGRYTDPQFGEFTSDFIAQFNCTDDFEFPEAVQEITGLTLFVQYTKFFGDSPKLHAHEN